MGMDEIKQAVMSRVQAEAEDIKNDANEKAQEEIEKAKKERQARFEEEKGRLLEQAREEAARVLAQASIEARQKISRTKADVVDRVIDGAREQLGGDSSADDQLAGLIREAVEGLGAAKGRIYVSGRDVDNAKKILEEDSELSDRVVEVRETDCLGGVIAEDVDGKLRVDNTYETRLEMLLPRLLPEMSKDLFEST